MPLRSRPAVASSTMTEGISGSSVRGCGKRVRDVNGRERLQLLNRDGLRQRETTSLRAPKRCKVRTAAGELAQIMRDGANISTRGDMHRELRNFTIERIQREAMNRYARRLHRHLFAGTRELMRGHTANLLRGIYRWNLIDGSMEACCECAKIVERAGEAGGPVRRRSFRVERVGRKAEANSAGVILVGFAKELREASEFAEQQRQDAGGHGIERAEVTDAALTRRSAHEGHYIMRRHTGWLIDDQEPVHRITFLPAGVSRVDQRQELASGLQLRLEDAKHGARYGVRALLFDTAHHHAKVLPL